MYKIGDEVFYCREGKVYPAKIAGRDQVWQYLVETDEFTSYAHPDDIYTSRDIASQRVRNQTGQSFAGLIEILNGNTTEFNKTFKLSDLGYEYAVSVSIRAKDGEYELTIKRTKN